MAAMKKTFFTIQAVLTNEPPQLYICDKVQSNVTTHYMQNISCKLPTTNMAMMQNSLSHI